MKQNDFSSILKRLSLNQIIINVDFKSIAIPLGTELSKSNMIDIEKLQSIGYLVIHATIPSEKLF